MMRAFGAAVLLGVLLLGSGCGGSDRPTADEISKSLRSDAVRSDLGETSAFSKKAADCIGKALVKSEVSDAGLRGFIKDQKDYSPTKKDTAAFGKVLATLAACNPVEAP